MLTDLRAVHDSESLLAVTEYLRAQLPSKSVVPIHEALSHWLDSFDPAQCYPLAWWRRMLLMDLDGERPYKIPSHEPFTQCLQRQVQNLVRHLLQLRFGYSIPARETLAAIADFTGSHLVEHAAGAGYWASLLSSHFGVAVDATDKNEGEFPQNTTGHSFLPVRTCDLITAEPGREPVMLSWLPLNRPIADTFLQRMASGQKLVFISQSEPATNRSTMEVLKTHFVVRGEATLARFNGVFDFVRFLERK